MKKWLIVFFVIIQQPWLIAQSPTVQDCLGAIPICQNQYTQTNAFWGDGNYHSEINSNISCLDDEYYSVWYTFTAQTSGYFRFTISPNTYSDDYDWAVFDLTHANCSDIFNNSSLCVSCNSFGDFDGANGPTGSNSANGGYDNWNGPGTDNGPRWNADIPVVAGNTYAMLICNWSQSTSGYSLNFSGSSASIFDNVPPTLAYVNNLNCGDSFLQIQFSENVLCNSVQFDDFKLIGPSGIIPITSCLSSICQSGGTQDRYYKLQTTQLLQKGIYKLILCGSVNDLCGNTSSVDTIMFSIDGLHLQTSSTPSICSPNGTATCIVSEGQTPYIYHWGNGGNTSTNSGLTPGNYSLTVTDSRGCVDSAMVSVPSGSGSMSISMEKQDIACYGMQSGWAKAIPISGQSPFTYHWSNGVNMSLNEQIPTGKYYVSVTDVYGCATSDSVEIFQNPPFLAFVDSTRNEICSYSNGAVYVHAEGGTEPYLYQWSASSSANASLLYNVHAGNYTVTISDAANCAIILTADVEGQPYPVADFSAIPSLAFIYKANIRFQNQSENYTNTLWNFGDGFESTDENPFHQYQAVGIYPVRLVVSSQNSCTDTIVKNVNIVEELYVYIPNAFSPDSDGVNDLFGPSIYGASPSNYLFEIFSRWGELLFQTTQMSKYWDAKSISSSEISQFGTYTYRIRVDDLTGITHQYVGNVSIVR